MQSMENPTKDFSVVDRPGHKREPFVCTGTEKDAAEDN